MTRNSDAGYELFGYGENLSAVWSPKTASTAALHVVSPLQTVTSALVRVRGARLRHTEQAISDHTSSDKHMDHCTF